MPVIFTDAAHKPLIGFAPAETGRLKRMLRRILTNRGDRARLTPLIGAIQP